MWVSGQVSVGGRVDRLQAPSDLPRCLRVVAVYRLNKRDRSHKRTQVTFLISINRRFHVNLSSSVLHADCHIIIKGFAHSIKW